MGFHGFCGFEGVVWRRAEASDFEEVEVEIRGPIHAIRISRRLHVLAFDQLSASDRKIQLFSESAKTVPIWSIENSGGFLRLVRFEIIENQGGISVMAVFGTLVSLGFLSREAG